MRQSFHKDVAYISKPMERQYIIEPGVQPRGLLVQAHWIAYTSNQKTSKPDKLVILPTCQDVLSQILQSINWNLRVFEVSDTPHIQKKIPARYWKQSIHAKYIDGRGTPLTAKYDETHKYQAGNSKFKDPSKHSFQI